MKTILIFFLSVYSITSLIGQNFSIGPEVGINSSISSAYKPFDMENRRNTYIIGINLQYHFIDRVSFTSGLHYLRQGYKHSTCYLFKPGVKNELIGKFDYLAVPIIANLHLLKSRKMIISIGLLGAFIIKAGQDYPERIGGCDLGYVSNLSLVTEKFSCLGIIGAGYKIFEKNKFELISYLKYYHGLSNTYKEAAENPFINIDRRFSSTLLTLNFNYKI
jgi:hypothetical protein